MVGRAGARQGRAVQQGAALPLLGVQRRLGQVFGGHGQHLQPGHGVQAGGHIQHPPGHLHHLHLRQGVAHRRAFMVAVIDKDERVEPDIQLGSQRPQVVGFGQPVDAPGGKVGLAQHLVRVLTQHRVKIGGVVLAAQRQDEAALLQAQDAALEIDKQVARVVGAELDAVDAVLAHHAAPQRVVGIEHQHLGPGRDQQRADGQHPARDLKAGGGRKRVARRVPEALVKKAAAAHLQHHLVQVQQQGRRHALAQPLADIGLEGRPPGRLRQRGLAVVQAQRGCGQRRQQRDHQLPHFLRAPGQHQVLQALQRLGAHAGLAGCVQAGQWARQMGVQVFALQQQQRDIGRMAQQGRAGAGLLQGQAVGRVVGAQGQALQRGRQVEPGAEQLTGVAVHDGQPQRAGGRAQRAGMGGDLLGLGRAGRAFAGAQAGPQVGQAGQAQQLVEIGDRHRKKGAAASGPFGPQGCRRRRPGLEKYKPARLTRHP